MNKFLVAFLISINSGLSYALIGSTFTAYLRDNNIDLMTIGILSLRGIPYSFKYFWAPLIENVKIKFFPADFGQRKSWLMMLGILNSIFISIIALIDVKNNLHLVWFCSFCVSLTSATYDIAMEAFRIELFKKDNLNRGTMFNILGFRFGLIISGTIGLYLSSIYDWQIVYLILAVIVFINTIAIYFSKDLKVLQKNKIKSSFRNWFKDNFLFPFIILFKRKHIIPVITTIAFYKLSDGYIDAMINPFLMDIGYTKTKIALFGKTIGVLATVTGTFVGSYLLSKFNTIYNLLLAEVLSGLTNLLFIKLINSNQDTLILSIAISLDSFVSGMCNIILIQYMSLLCNKKFTAIHYAILISISSLAKNILSSSSGWVAETFGWEVFFQISASLIIPSIISILILQSRKNYSI